MVINKEKKRVYLSLLYFLFLFVNPVIFSSGIIFYLIHQAALLVNIEPFYWIVFFAGSVVSMAFALTPTTFIALLSGYFLQWNAVLGVVPAYLLASILGFFIAGFIDQGALIHYVSGRKKVAIFLQRLKQREFSFIILSRLSPVLPFAMMNFVLSAMKVRLKTYMIAGFLGMLPRTLLFIWVGSMAHDIQEAMASSRENALVHAFAVSLVILSIAGIIYLIGRSLQKDADQSNSVNDLSGGLKSSPNSSK